MRFCFPVLTLILLGFLIMPAMSEDKASTQADKSTASAKSTTPNPPVCKKIPKILTAHGHERVDPYYWLRERENPEVISYLKAENTYTDSMIAPYQSLIDTLFKETKARIKQTDMSVPYTVRGYEYYSRQEDGKQYSISCRRVAKEGAKEAVMLDINKLAEGHEYCSVSGQTVSPNDNLLAYGVDTAGRRYYTVYVKDLTTGKLLSDVIPDITGNLVWAEDNKTLFYSKQDPKTLRAYQIYRHTLGTKASEDVLVYEEKDDTFSTYVYKTRSKKFIIIGSSQTLSSEYRFVDAKKPDGEFKLILPRERKHEYSVDHFNGHFYIRTNDNAKNFRLVRTPEDSPSKTHWEEVIAHRDDVYFSGFELFDDYLVTQERREGLVHILIKPLERS